MKNLLSFACAVFLFVLAVLGCAKSDANTSGANPSAPKSFVSAPIASPTFSANAKAAAAKQNNRAKQAAAATASASLGSGQASTVSPLDAADDEDDEDARSSRSGRRSSAGSNGSSGGSASSGKIVSPEINRSGASAKCRDGSLSYSAHRRGTCSHHGGVAIWY